MKPLVGTSSNGKTAKVDMGVELTVPGATSEPEAPAKPKTPSRDSPIRWLSLFLFLVVIILFLIVLVVMVAID